jgi:hypothetical protein
VAIVYAHYKKTNNEIFYIGIGDNISRAYEWGRNNHWCNIVKKYDYEVEILIDDITWELACEYEMYLIEFYGRFDKKLGPLVNLTDGGDGSLGYIHLDVAKSKMRKRRSEEAKANMRKPKSNEHKTKLSLSLIGRKKSRESELKRIKSREGYKHSEETKAKMKGPKEKAVCPHCNKEGGAGNMKRWHFDNCKNKIYE